MSTRTLNPKPSRSAIAAAQLHMLALLQKRDFLVLGAVLSVLGALVVWGYTQMSSESAGSGTMVIFPALAMPLALVGALWPLGVWREDSPERRGYFWSLPVDRRQHTVFRVGIGWAVLLGVCAAVMALAVAAAAPAVVRFEELRLDLGQPWLPLATATLAYVLVSALAVLFDSPIRWVAWAWFAVLGVFVVGEATDLDTLSEGVEDVVESFFVALSGPLVAPDEASSVWARYYLIWLGLGAAALTGAILWRRNER